MLRANDSRGSGPTQRRGSCRRQRNFSLRSSICRTTPRSVPFGEEAADDGTSCGTGTEAGLAAALSVLGGAGSGRFRDCRLLATFKGPTASRAARPPLPPPPWPWETNRSTPAPRRALVDAGFLIARGEKRGRFYVASPEIVRVRREMRDTRDARDDADPFAR